MAIRGETRTGTRWARILLAVALASVWALRPADPAAATDAGTPSAASCPAPAAQSFGGGSWPPACWRPYGDRSPFNRRLPARPRLERHSQRIVRETLRERRIQAFLVGHPQGSGDDYGHPVYYAGTMDPVYTVRCVRWVRHCEVDGMRVRVPSEALPASGSDAHMAVVDVQSRWEYDFWEVRTVPLPPFGGTITIGHGGRTRWGTRRATGLRSNATAAHFGLSAGVIRAEEWAGATAAKGSIDHALFIGVGCTNGRSVYPAVRGTSGTVCRSRYRRRFAPPLGTRYELDMTWAEIDALKVPAWKRPILKAMARYGMIVGDTFGSNRHAFGLVAESDTQYAAFGHPGRFAELGRAWGAPVYDGAYWFDIASGVKWREKLRVVRPCVSRETC